jgi:hypothetical protein
MGALREGQPRSGISRLWTTPGARRGAFAALHVPGMRRGLPNLASHSQVAVSTAETAATCCGTSLAFVWGKERRAAVMRILDQLLGESRESDQRLAWLKGDDAPAAVDCYRYLLRTAPPLAIERAHTEAFARLTQQQQRAIAQSLRHELRNDDRWPADQALEPRALAQLVTQVELRDPGSLERALGAGRTFGHGLLSLFDTVARVFTTTGIAQQFLGGIDYDGAVTEPPDELKSELELEYEEAEYDTAPLECFVGRNGVDL